MRNQQPDILGANKTEIVEEAILMSETLGAHRAAAFMVKQGINDRTIVRVLSEPGQRRGAR